MNSEPKESTKRNWPLIWTASAVGIILAGLVITSIALYVANFNLLEWIE